MQTLDAIVDNLADQFRLALARREAAGDRNFRFEDAELEFDQNPHVNITGFYLYWDVETDTVIREESEGLPRLTEGVSVAAYFTRHKLLLTTREEIASIFRAQYRLRQKSEGVYSGVGESVN